VNSAPQCDDFPGRDVYLASSWRPAVHLLGAGKVGQCFLDLCQAHGLALVAVSDSSGTLHSSAGLDCAAVAAQKRSGAALRELEGAGAGEFSPSPIEDSLQRVSADLVVDCLPSELSTRDAAATRVRELLDQGRYVILASKAALLADTRGLLQRGRRARLGIRALLGGAGHSLIDELDELRERTKRILCVPNATTTLVVQAIESGSSYEEALGIARREGLLESDPTQDLDGRDAALKLGIVSQAIFERAVGFDTVKRPSAFPHAELLRDRVLVEETTRLVGTCTRDERPSLSCRAISRSGRLAIPWQRVAYGYEFEDGSLRLHIGEGVGPLPTAVEALRDFYTLLARRR
jgi:homoserine dehydrogenase